MDRVEELGVPLPESQALERRGQRMGQGPDSSRNGPEPLGPVIDGVHGRHVGQQCLRGADVRRRLLAPDVLFPCLQRHAVGGTAAAVDRHADDTARHLADVCVPGREKGRVRSPVAQWDAETLRVADYDVGAEFTGRRQQRQRQQIGGHDHEHAGGMRFGDEFGQLVDPAAFVRVLHEEAERVVVEVHGGRICLAHDQPQRLGTRSQHRSGLRPGARRHQERAPGRRPLRLHAVQQRHRLGGRRGLVEQRRVGDVHARQVADHGLEIEQRLQSPLGDLCLIRGVGGVPPGVLEDVPEDDWRRDRVGVAQPDERAAHAVARGRDTQLPQVVVLGAGRRQRQRAVEPDGRRHDLVDQRVKRRRLDHTQHVSDLGRTWAEMAVLETIGMLEVHR